MISLIPYPSLIEKDSREIPEISREKDSEISRETQGKRLEKIRKD